MYKLTYEVRVRDRRAATAIVLPLNYSISHALAEAAAILSRETYRLHTMTLEELAVQDNEYRVKFTLLRYEAEGL